VSAGLHLIRANTMRIVPATPTGITHTQSDNSFIQTKQ
jgi:hypothetical protein